MRARLVCSPGRVTRTSNGGEHMENASSRSLLIGSLLTGLLLPPALLASYLIVGRLAGEGTPSLVFDWERRIPLVPWMAVPYLGAGPALRRRRAALLGPGRIARADLDPADRHGRRRDRVPDLADGRGPPARLAGGRMGGRLSGALVGRSREQPIAFASRRVCGGPVDRDRTAARGLVAALLHAGCVVVIVSTLFTWQHHVADVIAGGLLGAIASISVSRLCRSRSSSRNAPGPNSHSAAVQPNATPVHVPRSQ